MRLMSIVQESKGAEEPPAGLRAALLRLRSAVDEETAPPGGVSGHGRQNAH
jgi:hypothetical protein